MTQNSNFLDLIASSLMASNPVRETLPSGARLHMDRPLPFICVHREHEGARLAAYDVTTSNASYLVAPDLDDVIQVLNCIGQTMIKRFGAFLVIEVSEFEQDRLLMDDSPYLPDFEIVLSTGPDGAGQAAIDATAIAIESVDAKYRSPVISRVVSSRNENDHFTGLDPEISLMSIQFAPIYRQPESDAIYPELRARLVDIIFDAVLHGAASFAQHCGAMNPTSHRALGRSSFVDTVRKLDMKMDEVCNSFDFLMAITPINTTAAWQQFQDANFDRVPPLLYRPLTVEVDVQKSALHSIAFENLEDPVLSEIYRDRQQELDLQLTAIDMRDTNRFREASRLLYGPVEDDLLQMAQAILALPVTLGKSSKGEGGLEGHVDCYELREAACQMVDDYRAEYAGFDAEVVIRDDLPAGMMVSGSCLMISRNTRMSRSRVRALLSHEIGVHVLTYFNGDAQGLRIFRTGLAGYEGIQEGLAVFAEYLVGGMTQGRLRLLAGRVVGCAAMLDGADFLETFRLLTRDHSFSESAAFNLTVRLYRSGGLAKDAIYLRGLQDVLAHVAAGKSLGPYWLGKFSKKQLPRINELSARGLLNAAPITPTFLLGDDAQKRLIAARSGLSPVDLVSE